MALRSFSRPLITLLFVFSTFVSSLSFPAQQTANALNGECDYDFFEGSDPPIRLYDPCSPICSSSSSQGSAVTQLKGENNRDKIWNYLITRGLSPTQAAGVMGNLQSESGGTWSPTVNEFGEEFGEGGYGIAQWTHDPGRRANLVTYMRGNYPNLMDTYYTADYSTEDESYTTIEEGFVSKNATTEELMPVDDNDRLLLAQLNFLYDEATNRPLSASAVDKGLGSSDSTEWEALQGIATLQGASDIWLYSFEIPENIGAASPVRAADGQVIYNIYASETEDGVCPSNSKQAIAQQIIDSGNVRYWVGGMPEKERNLLAEIASGANNGNDWPCGMNLYALQMLAALTVEHVINISSLNRACSGSVPNNSGTWSRHYAGNGSAFDLDYVDSMNAESYAAANLVVEIISPYLLPGARIGQVQCLPNLNLPEGVGRLVDDCTHLHVDMPASIDPPLRCKVPITAGGCDESQRV